MIETTIVFIVKNKYGHITDSNTYIPNALSTIVSKLFEYVHYLTTSINQFGFKPDIALTYAYML